MANPSYASTRPADVAVVGSANLDVVLRVAALPAPGETALASDRSLGPGGKGANQAAAAARLGAQVRFLAAMGVDPGRELLLSALDAAGVDTAGVRASATPTGTAYVIVDDDGENQIVVEAGANSDLRDLNDAELSLVSAARVVLAQLEVPVMTVTAALRRGREVGAMTILNAAPAMALPRSLTEIVDVLVVNEAEARAVAGGPASLPDALTTLTSQVQTVVVTLGAEGALIASAGGDVTRVPAVPARRVVDTTGAGDAFCGAFAAAAARGLDPVAATRWATIAASLSVERPGAGSSATAAEVHQRQAELEPRDGEPCG